MEPIIHYRGLYQLILDINAVTSGLVQILNSNVQWARAFQNIMNWQNPPYSYKMQCASRFWWGFALPQALMKMFISDPSHVDVEARR